MKTITPREAKRLPNLVTCYIYDLPFRLNADLSILGTLPEARVQLKRANAIVWKFGDVNFLVSTNLAPIGKAWPSKLRHIMTLYCKELVDSSRDGLSWAVETACTKYPDAVREKFLQMLSELLQKSEV